MVIKQEKRRGRLQELDGLTVRDQRNVGNWLLTRLYHLLNGPSDQVQESPFTAWEKDLLTEILFEANRIIQTKAIITIEKVKQTKNDEDPSPTEDNKKKLLRFPISKKDLSDVEDVEHLLQIFDWLREEAINWKTLQKFKSKNEDKFLTLYDLKIGGLLGKISASLMTTNFKGTIIKNQAISKAVDTVFHEIWDSRYAEINQLQKQDQIFEFLQSINSHNKLGTYLKKRALLNQEEFQSQIMTSLFCVPVAEKPLSSELDRHAKNLPQPGESLETANCQRWLKNLVARIDPKISPHDVIKNETKIPKSKSQIFYFVERIRQRAFELSMSAHLNRRYPDE